MTAAGIMKIWEYTEVHVERYTELVDLSSNDLIFVRLEGCRFGIFPYFPRFYPTLWSLDIIPGQPGPYHQQPFASGCLNS
jgi:hypothetical protein